MSVFLLAIYTALVLIRPMDWWEPILNWQIVTVVAIATLLTTFPKILAEAKGLWTSLPELKMGAAWVIGAAASWIPAFWLGGINMVFQELGKIYIYLFLIFLLARTNQGYRALLWTVLLCTIWLAIHSILLYHRGYGFGPATRLWRPLNWDSPDPEGVWQTRAYGTFEDPNDLCLIFITTIPLLYAEFQASKSFGIKALALSAIPLVGYGVITTNSRGGYVGIFAMIAAYIIGRLKGFRRWFMLAFSIFFLTVFAPSRFAKGLTGQQDRSILWGDGVAMFKENKFFGVGWSMFTSYQSQHKVAHNTYVHVLAETGIIGYLPFFMLLYFSFLHLRRAMNLGAHLSKQDRTQITGLFAAAVGYFTSIYFLSRQSTHLPYIMMGLMGVMAIRACRTPEMFAKVFINTGKEYRRALLWGLGSIGFMWVTIRVVNAMG